MLRLGQCGVVSEVILIRGLQIFKLVKLLGGRWVLNVQIFVIRIDPSVPLYQIYNQSLLIQTDIRCNYTILDPDRMRVVCINVGPCRRDPRKLSRR